MSEQALSVKLSQGEGSAAGVEESLPSPKQQDLETIKQSALARERRALVEEKLQEIRAERLRPISPQRGTGLFRRIFRSLRGAARRGEDFEEAKRLADEAMATEGSRRERIETIFASAAESFSDISETSHQGELKELMGLISQRYKLEDDSPGKAAQVAEKVKHAITSNSWLFNFAVGATFRVAFRSLAHIGGLGGAVAASGVYGAVSGAVREHSKIRKEEMGTAGWRQELEKLETPRQKLALMRQIISGQSEFRRYFAGNSSEAFEFFGIFQDLLKKEEQTQITDGSAPFGDRQNIDIREIYKAKKIGRRVLLAAGKGALKAGLFSALGYGVAHWVAEGFGATPAYASDTDGTAASSEPLLAPVVEPALGEPATIGGDASALGESGAEITPEGETEGNWPLEWREGRLKIAEGGLFVEDAEPGELANYSLVNVESPTGSTPEQVAKVIVQNIKISDQGAGGASFQLGSEQADKLTNKIAEWLEENHGSEIDNGKFAYETTIRVPAGVINDGLQDSGIDNLSINLPEAEGAPPPADSAVVADVTEAEGTEEEESLAPEEADSTATEEAAAETDSATPPAEPVDAEEAPRLNLQQVEVRETYPGSGERTGITAPDAESVSEKEIDNAWKRVLSWGALGAGSLFLAVSVAKKLIGERRYRGNRKATGGGEDSEKNDNGGDSNQNARTEEPAGDSDQAGVEGDSNDNGRDDDSNWEPPAREEIERSLQQWAEEMDSGIDACDTAKQAIGLLSKHIDRLGNEAYDYGYRHETPDLLAQSLTKAIVKILEKLDILGRDRGDGAAFIISEYGSDEETITKIKDIIYSPQKIGPFSEEIGDKTIKHRYSEWLDYCRYIAGALEKHISDEREGVI